MVRIAKLAALLFRLLNFIFDCIQTWQFTGGGGMSGIIAAIIAFYQELPYWTLPIIAICAGIVVVILLALIFKAFTKKKHELKTLSRLPRLVYDMHKKICNIRVKLVKKTDWNNIDTNKVLLPIMDAAFSEKPEQSSELDIDNMVDEVSTNLDKAGKLMRGASSVLDTYMKESDTSLESELQDSFWYRVLLARLEAFKPYPNDAIRKDVQLILDSSMSFNNTILFLLYAPYVSLSPEIDLTNKNVEKLMNDNIDSACARLEEHIAEYLEHKDNKNEL